jgi:hypothetical protein
MIEGEGNAFGIEISPDIDGLVERITRHEPGGEASGQRRGFHPFSEVSLAREKEKETAHDFQANTVRAGGFC